MPFDERTIYTCAQVPTQEFPDSTYLNTIMNFEYMSTDFSISGAVGQPQIISKIYSIAKYQLFGCYPFTFSPHSAPLLS